MNPIEDYKKNVYKVIEAATTPKEKRKVARFARDIWVPELFKVIEAQDKKIRELLKSAK